MVFDATDNVCGASVFFCFHFTSIVVIVQLLAGLII